MSALAQSQVVRHIPPFAHSSVPSFDVALLAQLPFGVALLDPNLRYIYVNPALAGLDGHPVVAYPGKTVAEMVPHYAPQLESSLRQVLATGEAVTDVLLSNTPLVGAEGASHWRVSCFPIRTPGGEIDNLEVVVTEVTPGRHAALFESLIMHAPVGIAFVDKELRFQQINDHLAALNGRPAVDHVGRTIREAFPHLPSALLTELERPFHQILATGEPILGVEVAATAPMAPGDLRTWRYSYFPVQDTQGRMLGCGAIVQDVTEQRRTEQSLDEQRRQLEAMLEALDEGVLAVKRNGVVLLSNGAMQNVIEPAASQQQSSSQPCGQMLYELYRADGEALQPNEQPFTRIARGEQFSNLEFQMRATGEIESRWLSLSGVPVPGPDPAEDICLLVVRDITQHKRDEVQLRAHAEALQQTNTRLVQALRTQSEFLAMMSHELRTPLHAVLGYSESLAAGIYGPVTESQNEALARVAQSGRHLLSLLSDILDLARIEARVEVLETRPVDVNELCRSALELVKWRAQEKKIRLIQTLCEAHITLQADERRLTQILVNLLDNAVKFTPTGGIVGLAVTASSEREQVVFTVWDTGIGIAVEDTERLFQPFTQLDSRLSRSYEGIGLGLALVQRLTELHGGNVEVESTPGSGSSFIVTLPWSPANTSRHS